MFVTPFLHIVAGHGDGMVEAFEAICDALLEMGLELRAVVSDMWSLHGHLQIFVLGLLGFHSSTPRLEQTRERTVGISEVVEAQNNGLVGFDEDVS